MKFGKRLFALTLAAMMSVAFLAGCSSDESTDSSDDNSSASESDGTGETKELTFLYWADGVQKDLIEEACAEYETQTGVKINAEALPADGSFDTYIQTHKESDTLPDISYMDEGAIMKYYESGILASIEDVDIPKKLDAITITAPDGEVIGVGLSNQLEILFYNKDMFDEAGVDYPPTDVSQAWSWDEFVENAKLLTVDTNGNNATEADFDSNKIMTYGFGANATNGFHTMWTAYANGGGVVSSDGTDFLWDDAKSAEGLQNFVDLINVHHVASPIGYTWDGGIGSVDSTIGTGGYAMYMNGSWDLANMTSITDVNVGVGVLPKMEQAMTMNCGAPMVIYNTSKYMDEAKDFYAFMVDPEKNLELLKTGAWLPNEESYYTDQDKIDSWTSELPQDAVETLISYSTTEGSIAQWPAYYVPAYDKMNNEYTKVIDKAFGGEKTVAEVYEECMPEIKSLFESGTAE